jgi:hypothetical protein
MEKRAGPTQEQQVWVRATGPAWDSALDTCPWLPHSLVQVGIPGPAHHRDRYDSHVVTLGLGTQVLGFTGAGGWTGTLTRTCRETHSPTGLPPCHGPGSRPSPCQVCHAQGEKGLGVLCLHLSGDCQTVGHHPPRLSPNPNALARTPAGIHHRGESLLGRGHAVHSQTPGSGAGPLGLLLDFLVRPGQKSLVRSHWGASRSHPRCEQGVWGCPYAYTLAGFPTWPWSWGQGIAIHLDGTWIPRAFVPLS